MRGRLSLVGVCALLLAAGAVAQTAVTTSGGTANSVPVFTGTASVGSSVITQSNGDIGIGTAAPDASIDVVGVSRFELTSSSNATSALMNAGNINDVIRINAPWSENPGSSSNAGAAWGIRFIGDTDPDPGFRNTTGKGPAIFAVSEETSAGYNRANGLAFYTNTLDTAAAERVRISNAGNVGIGTIAPGAKLEVDGNIKLTSGSGASITFADGTVQSTAWTGSLCGGDYAEAVSGAGDRASYEPGDVLVLNGSDDGDVIKSTEPYSTAVAGIYSTKPGLIGRRQATKSDLEIPMAMVGIVPTKVSAENGPIRRGDLLVTSSTAGYAMKGTDRSQMLGAIVGKAMGNLESGTGVIEVLVSLQ